MRILLKIQYDGTHYAGFQRQANALTVQEKLENILNRVLGETIKLQAASRTDSGVHARGQMVSFCVDGIRIPLDRFPDVLNAALPEDISVVNSELVPDDFHPRFDAKQKTYTYSFLNTQKPNPFLSRYSFHVAKKLRLLEMQNACGYFLGEHDFAAFCATGGSQKTTIREIYDIGIAPRENGLIKLTVTGNAFLYNMVRIIAGTVFYVGIGKLPASSVGDIIRSKQRARAGKTMPPHGLVLEEVLY